MEKELETAVGGGPAWWRFGKVGVGVGGIVTLCLALADAARPSLTWALVSLGCVLVLVFVADYRASKALDAIAEAEKARRSEAEAAAKRLAALESARDQIAQPDQALNEQIAALRTQYAALKAAIDRQPPPKPDPRESAAAEAHELWGHLKALRYLLDQAAEVEGHREAQREWRDAARSAVAKADDAVRLARHVPETGKVAFRSPSPNWTPHPSVSRLQIGDCAAELHRAERGLSQAISALRNESGFVAGTVEDPLPSMQKWPKRQGG